MRLEKGNKIPIIKAQDQNGKLVTINPDHLNAPLVIYFYPKDDTPGCTKEACSFRDSHEVFSEAGVKVYGISGDSVDRHKKFEEKYRLPFTLLSDHNNEIRASFGVPTDLLGLLPGRVTYVINAQGVIVRVFKSQLRAEQHVNEALAALQDL